MTALGVVGRGLRVKHALQREIHLHKVETFSLYLTENTHRLRYKAQPVNAV
jgi:hypothetical protein